MKTSDDGPEDRPDVTQRDDPDERDVDAADIARDVSRAFRWRGPVIFKYRRRTDRK